MKYGNTIKEKQQDHSLEDLTPNIPSALQDDAGTNVVEEGQEELYERFVAASPQGSIYCYRWWLDAVAPSSYDVLEVRKGNKLLAAWPIAFGESERGRTVQMPRLTQKLGILFRPPQAKYAEELSRQHSLTEQLIDQLPSVSHFMHHFHDNFFNWLPFYWREFQQTTRYTYILPDLSDENVCWNIMRTACRSEIRKAQKLGISIVDDIPLEQFLKLYDETFLRQDRMPSASHELIVRLDDAIAQHAGRKIFAAVDNQGRLHAAAYIAWCDSMSYYLMGGSDPELRRSGGLRLALWEAIRFSRKVSRSFDFEGSMIRPVESNCRSFGAMQMPYFAITKFDRADRRPRLHPKRVVAGVLRRIANRIDS